jgi:phage-related protein
MDKVFGEEFPKAYEKDVKAFEAASNKKVKGFTKDLATMEKTFDKLTTKVNNFKDAIKSGFSDVGELVSGALDAIQEHQDMLANLREQGWVGEDWGAGGGVGDFLANQVAGAKDFATKLAQLSAAGLAPAVLSELASQGPEALPLVNALLEGGEGLIKDFNAAQVAINKFATVTADSLSDAQFGGAIKKAKHSITELGNEIDKFVNQFANHTGRLADSIQKLSQALNQAVSGLGGKVPHMAKGGIITKPTLLLAGEAGPEEIRPLGKGRGGDIVNVYLNVEGNAVYSHDLADEVRDILLKDKRYKRTLGLS